MDKIPDSFPWRPIGIEIVIVALLMLIIGFLFPEARIYISSIIVTSFGVLLGSYLVSRVWKRRSEIRILRMGYIAGGVTLGILAWSFIVIPLAFVLPVGFLEGVILFLLCPVLMAMGAVIMDAVGKRRDYRPFMEARGGNI
jgi:uncharacterized membrane protein